VKISNTWLNDALINEIKAIFEPRYNKSLSDAEVVQIAENIAAFMEACCKWKWKNTYENQ
jgi:hypothetical protein